MLYFSKIKIIAIIIITAIFVYFTASNFFKFDNNFLKKKINLGLDLQGGSYLLLEIDNKPVITQRLQNKLSTLRKYFKKENINFKNLKIINNEIISFELKKRGIKNFDLSIFDWFKLVKEVREKKFGQNLPLDYKTKAKQKRFLKSRGFDFDQINKAFLGDI